MGILVFIKCAVMKHLTIRRSLLTYVVTSEERASLGVSERRLAVAVLYLSDRVSVTSSLSPT